MAHDTTHDALVHGRPSPPAVARERSSMITGALWMTGISIALFFIPAINGLVGGLVGGYKIGHVRRALIASLIPAAVVALATWLIIAFTDAPVIGLFAGLAAGILILFADFGLFVGAAIGGWLGAQPRAHD